MDLPQLRAVLNYWERCPPVHELFAAFAGYKAPRQREVTAAPATQKAGALLADLAASGIAIPPEILREMDAGQAAPRDGEAQR
jgi:hypothetical protein